VPSRIGIFHPTDPVGNVPGGIDSFIRGILQWAPPDLEYHLYGATSAPAERPIGEVAAITLGERSLRYTPLINVDPAATRTFIPLTVQYMRALAAWRRAQRLAGLAILDFHRLEPSFLFRGDRRPKNVILHQDMSVIREQHSDIKWRYLPWLYERFEGHQFRDMDRIFTVRQSAVDRYRALYPQLEGKFAFIPTWVDTSVFWPSRTSAERERLRVTLCQKLGVATATRILVFVGRLDRQKDPLLLLEAFRQTLQRQGDLHLVVVGDGTLRGKLEAAIARNNLVARVSLMGALPRTAIADVLRSADLFVLSSAYEGMPIAVLEALASGVPVVSTDVGELSRVVIDGMNGFLAKDKSAEALADAVLFALGSWDRMWGPPCGRSVDPYTPQRILANIYENHRRQAAELTTR
jgi:glycosyltransferase involved in cell wall biosynthesis